MRVLKFGGSSISSVDRIRSVGQIIKNNYAASDKSLAVVFSAFGGVTDLIQEMCALAASGNKKYLEIAKEFKGRHLTAAQHLLEDQYDTETRILLEENHDMLSDFLKGIFLLKEVSPRTRDLIWSFGERNSTFIISKYLQSQGLPAIYLDSRKFIKSNNDYGNAKVDLKKSYHLIKEHFSANKGQLFVVTGFIASTEDNSTTTLGRGGSDYTASLIAAAINAEDLRIWTDVDGVLTSNPKVVSDAFTIPSLSYDEAMELSHFGAKVIYPPTIRPAFQQQIPIYIKNTFNPDAPGTLISSESDGLWTGYIKGISSLEHISLITLQGAGMVGVPGVAARLFKAISEGGINIILITQGSSEHSICFAIQNQDAILAKEKIEAEFNAEIQIRQIDPVIIEQDLSIIAVVGENMQHIPGVAGRLFQSLGRNGVNVVAIAQGSSELNISFVVPRKDLPKALNLIHDAFFLSGSKHVHLFVVGLGLIGKTLLEQIKAQSSVLKKDLQIDLKIVGLANTKRMLFDTSGINLENWPDLLINSSDNSDLDAFVNRLIAMNLPNSIFVDNTANPNLPGFYEKLLTSNIAISTPNKIAASSSYSQYSKLKQISAERGVPFLYETNVGAGLPIITTLKNLLLSGDKILKIEGVFSGSLSFIFSKFQQDIPFSNIVNEARDLGFTEPDPREDLSGADVRRKLTIMAREAGFPIEPDAIKIENILPPECIQAKSVDSFLETLIKFDDYFDNLKRKAVSQNKVLRCIARLENGSGEIKLVSVGSESPFYGLEGGDNMIVFTTERYRERPLVVRGPGAGAEVTAAGVFSEIITIANQNYFSYK